MLPPGIVSAVIITYNFYINTFTLAAAKWARAVQNIFIFVVGLIYFAI